MTDRTIAAYSAPERVAAYDANMEIMHPNRARMIEVAIEVLPFPPDTPLRAIDLGAGTGYFTARLLDRYPRATITALDGASAMIDLARARLGDRADRVRFVEGDFRRLEDLVPEAGACDVVVSSYALHHLCLDDKRALALQAWRLLREGGWLLNADLIVADAPEFEDRIQALRVEGIIRRAKGRDARFPDAITTRHLLDQLEAEDGDQPLTLAQDLDALRSAGFRAVHPFWVEHREAVCGALK